MSADVSCKDKVYDSQPVNLAIYFDGIKDKRVLDIGCGAGNLGAALKLQGNECYGITLSENEAALAQSRLSGVVVGDVEAMQALPFPRQFFDVVIFGDVLEHLRNPQRTLQLVKPYLKMGAKVIASIPNVANIEVRWDLLRGHFDYQPTGILDNTHLRFYTLGTAKELIASVGYQVEDVKFTHWNWELPRPIQMLLARYEWEVKTRMARWWPGLFATQFVIYAKHLDGARV